MINKKEQKDGGFTLLELLVATALFSIALVMALGAVLTIIDLNRKTQAMSSVTNNVNFAIESLVRVIKSSQDIDSASAGPGCSGPYTTQIELDYIDTYNIFPEESGTGQKTIYYRHNCTNGTIERQVEGHGWSPLTSTDDLEIVTVDFDVTDKIETVDGQEKVEILIEGLSVVGSETSEFIIQTTATRRQF